MAIMEQIDKSLLQSFEQVNAFEPLTLGLLKLASKTDTWGVTIRKTACLTVPMDHLIKTLSMPLIFTFDHFNDLINKATLTKIIATPIWWPIKTACKTAFFVLYFFTAGLKLPFEKWREIFQFENPSSSYQQSLDKLHRAFAISSGQPIATESHWEGKFVMPRGHDRTKFNRSIVQAFDKFYPNSPISKVFTATFIGRENNDKYNLDCHAEYNYFFASDGYCYGYNEDLNKNDPNVLLLYVSNFPRPNVEAEMADCTCKHYRMSFEDYLKLPYEMPEDLRNLLRV